MKNCTVNLETCKRDLELIKDYKTTTEVRYRISPWSLVVLMQLRTVRSIF